MRRSQPADLVVLTCSNSPVTLVALDAVTPSALAAVLRPALQLPRERVAVLAPRSVASTLIQQRLLNEPVDSNASAQGWHMAAVEGDVIPAVLRSARVVISAGHFLAAGALAFQWANHLGIPYTVAQHGLLTPFAPPLPKGATLFAFSDADAAFWQSGRPDVAAESVGGQMLWDAAHAETHTPVDVEARPVFLGQLHGAELPRHVSAATASAFCVDTGASYRPHPAETDRLSRWQHQRWLKQGVEVESTSKPLVSGRPVAAIFSTGVLEAAAAGMPAWVTCVAPPAWVEEFWERYGLAQWGGEPTPRPAQPTVEPSIQIAKRLREMGEQ